MKSVKFVHINIGKFVLAINFNVLLTAGVVLQSIAVMEYMSSANMRETCGCVCMVNEIKMLKTQWKLAHESE